MTNPMPLGLVDDLTRYPAALSCSACGGNFWNVRPLTWAEARGWTCSGCRRGVGRMVEVNVPPEKLRDALPPSWVVADALEPCEVCGDLCSGTLRAHGVAVCHACADVRRFPPVYRRPWWLRVLRWMARL